jgi:hypothetical protein
MSNEAARLCEEGLELMTQHRWEEAEEKMEQALDHDDQSSELWYNLGKCRFHQDKFYEAKSALCAAISIRMGEPSEEGIEFPVHVKKYPEAHALLGSCYYAQHELYKAKNCFRGALHPNNTPEFNRECETAAAHAALASGKYDRVDWFDYQQRLTEPDTWDGAQSLRGKTLLVKAEGGLGDQIFFARYADMLCGLGAGYAVWECDEPLLSYFDCGLEMITEKRGTIVEHDYMVHAGSLPYIFGTKMGTIPTMGGWSSPDVDNPKRIGLACSGNPLHPDDHHRSIPLAAFEPLFALDKNFYLMQKDVRHTDVEAFALSGMEKPEFTDVYAMAQRIVELDLVITVDTMTAHLAGAEGIPTILLLPYACDWRWGLEGDRTPWYPSIRIFRQGEDREWGPVIQKVVEELSNG